MSAAVAWQRPRSKRVHHQSGLTAYASRKGAAMPATRLEIQTGQIFAWNLSITASRAEEMLVLTERGPEVATRPPEEAGEARRPR